MAQITCLVAKTSSGSNLRDHNTKSGKRCSNATKRARQQVLAHSIERLADRSSYDLPSRVEYLAFPHAHLGDRGVKSLADALIENQTLRWLDLDDNRITSSGAGHLARVLSANTGLSMLDLDFNMIGDQGACAIASALAENRFLQELDLHFNQIGSDGAIRMSEALEVNSTLWSLSLHGNPIGDLGAMNIARALQKNCTIRDLHLSGTGITDKGALKLSEALKNNRVLWSLHLTDNEIGDVGATSFAKSLLTNPGLGELWLLKNKVTEVAAQELSQCLQKPGHLKGLRRLGVSFDNNASKPVPELLNSGRKNYSLQHAARNLESGVACLHLADEHLGDDGMKELVELIVPSKKLKELHLKTTSISDAGVQHLAEALQSCVSLERIHVYNGSSRLAKVLQKPRMKSKRSVTRRSRSRDRKIKSFPASYLDEPAPGGGGSARSDAGAAPMHSARQYHVTLKTVKPSAQPNLAGVEAAEDDHALLCFDDVPSTLGLDTLSNITDDFGEDGFDDVLFNIEEETQEDSTKDSSGSTLREAAAEGAPQERNLSIFDRIRRHFGRATLAESTPAPATVESAPAAQNMKLSFDQVPDDLPAISEIAETETICSSIPDIEILHFDQVPEELPVSDDEEEKKKKAEEDVEEEEEEEDVDENASKAPRDISRETKHTNNTIASEMSTGQDIAVLPKASHTHNFISSVPKACREVPVEDDEVHAPSLGISTPSKRLPTEHPAAAPPAAAAPPPPAPSFLNAELGPLSEPGQKGGQDKLWSFTLTPEDEDGTLQEGDAPAEEATLPHMRGRSRGSPQVDSGDAEPEPIRESPHKNFRSGDGHEEAPKIYVEDLSVAPRVTSKATNGSNCQVLDELQGADLPHRRL